MLYTKLIVCAVFMGSSLVGMDSPYKKLKVDLLQEKYNFFSEHDNILHVLAYNKTVTIDEPLVRELIQRGVDINQKNKDGVTPLEIAVSKNRMAACKVFYRLGARGDFFALLKLVIANLWYNDVASWCARKLIAQQRRAQCKTYFLSMHRINILPKALVLNILSYIPEFIPDSKLGCFYSRAKVDEINRNRVQECSQLLVEYRRWK